jgi:hypothetical protein
MTRPSSAFWATAGFWISDTSKLMVLLSTDVSVGACVEEAAKECLVYGVPSVSAIISLQQSEDLQVVSHATRLAHCVSFLLNKHVSRQSTRPLDVEREAAFGVDALHVFLQSDEISSFNKFNKCVFNKFEKFHLINFKNFI